uniref:Protein shisa-5 n=3 Tax=Muscicapidae TaxID=36291 RepID=A0A803VVV9_FICAL
MRCPLREKEAFSWYCSNRPGEREPEPQLEDGELRWGVGTASGLSRAGAAPPRPARCLSRFPRAAPPCAPPGAAALMALCRGVLGICLFLLLLLPAAVLGEDCPAYTGYFGEVQLAQPCPDFCCGTCLDRYCCSNVLLKFDEQKLQCNQLNERVPDVEDPVEALEKIGERLRNIRESQSNSWMPESQIFQDPDDLFDSPSPSFGGLIAIGVTVFAVIIITIILCLTCSCCCLYKTCRRPRPVVTTTATTTVVHSAYPQQPAVPPSYPAAPYQGYQPVAVQPQPGMPVAPYPAQYPPPYPMQPAGPPAYHETVAAGAGAPYPTQPPYNPAYMDPQKPTY